MLRRIKPEKKKSIFLYIFQISTSLFNFRNGVKIFVPLVEITTFVLRDRLRNCKEDMKEDTETLFIDPLYDAGYIVQKVRPRNLIKEPVIFKVKINAKNHKLRHFHKKLWKK